MPPSQYDRLVNDDLRRELRNHQAKAEIKAEAEIKVAQLYNRVSPKERVPLPSLSGGGIPAGARYPTYNHRLLAILWGVAGNAEALRALGNALGLPVPLQGADVSYSLLDDILLERMWTLGRDGAALQELWTRRGALLAAVDDKTPEAVLKEIPENVLGFRAWFDKNQRAKEVLFQKLHKVVSGSDTGQDRAVILLKQIGRWDYLNQPCLRRFLARCVSNLMKRQYRLEKQRPPAGEVSASGVKRGDGDLLGGGRVVTRLERPAPASAPPAANAARLEEVELAPVELRAVYKLKLNTEGSPQELTDEESKYLAERNLVARREDLDKEAIAREAERVRQWMLEHPGPTENVLRGLLPWYRQSSAGNAARDFSLRWTADEINRLLGPLLRGSPGSIEDTAADLQENIDELVQRAVCQHRANSQSCTVRLFACLTCQWAALRRWLSGRRWSAQEGANLGECLNRVGSFVDQFPILITLGASRRLTDWLLRQSTAHTASPILEELVGWLDGGHWVSSFKAKDRRYVEAFSLRLGAAISQPDVTQDRPLKLLRNWLDRAATQKGLPSRLWRELDAVWHASHEPELARFAGRVGQLIDCALGGHFDALVGQARALSGAAGGANLGGLGVDFQRSLDRLGSAAKCTAPTPAAGL